MNFRNDEGETHGIVGVMKKMEIRFLEEMIIMRDSERTD